MSGTYIFRLAAVSLAGLLAACGGGGGGGNKNAIPSTITLTSEQDVIREVSNLSSLYSDSGGAPAAAGGSARYGSTGLRGLAASGAAPRVRAKSTAQAETVQCDSGSYAWDEFFNVSRALPLFGVSPTMDYYISVDSNCRFVDGVYTETYNGRTEFGDSYAYSATTAESPDYYYFLDGSGSTPYTYTFRDSDLDETLTIRTLGRSEERDNGSIFESRETLTLDFTYSSGSESYNIDAIAGESGNPLIFVDDYAGGTFTVDGPLAYKSTDCRGGHLAFDTTTPMTVGSDAFGSFVSGGTLVISSGNASVTLVFQADGGVQYQFAGGSSGEVTRNELLASGECIFIP